MRIFYIFLILLTLVSVQVKSQSRLPSSDQDAKVIKFYPNPAITLITFDFQNAFDKSNQLQIFNFLGKKVYEAPTSDQKTMINLSDFFRGIYIFQLRDQTGKIIQTGKFQVSK
jgi:hypothetical protein